jgi:hypothetical protein
MALTGRPCPSHRLGGPSWGLSGCIRGCCGTPFRQRRPGLCYIAVLEACRHKWGIGGRTTQASPLDTRRGTLTEPAHEPATKTSHTANPSDRATAVSHILAQFGKNKKYSPQNKFQQYESGEEDTTSDSAPRRSVSSKPLPTQDRNNPHTRTAKSQDDRKRLNSFRLAK